jgi:hypothetical protein
MEQAASRASQTDVHMGDAQFDGTVGTLLGEVNVVNADDFSAAGVDDLLVEQVLADSKPALIRGVVLELLFFDVQFEDAGGNECEMIVTRDEWKEFPAPKQNPSDAIRLVGGFDEELGDVADEVAVLIVGFSAQEFRGVEHFSLLSRRINS